MDKKATYGARRVIIEITKLKIKMFDWLFGKKSSTRLGIDLGSASIKVVELGWKNERAYLLNYAMLQAKSGASFSLIDLKDEDIIKLLSNLMSEARISGRQVNVSLPVEKTFSTVITLPAMPENELAAAVSFEAQKYIPVPLSEVVLDWTVIANGENLVDSRALDAASVTPEKASLTSPVPNGATNESAPAISPGEAVLAKDKENKMPGAPKPGAAPAVQILLLAVPKETINRITDILSRAGLKVEALEQEAFSLSRSLIGNDKNTFMIIDISRRGTDIIVLDQGAIKLTHSLESVNKEIILMEIDRIVNIFQMRYNKKVGQCLLAGGRANEKDLFELLATKLKIPVKIGDPFARVSHDEKVSPFLKELAPQFSVAVGLAMRDN